LSARGFNRLYVAVLGIIFVFVIVRISGFRGFSFSPIPVYFRIPYYVLQAFSFFFITFVTVVLFLIRNRVKIWLAEFYMQDLGRGRKNRTWVIYFVAFLFILILMFSAVQNKGDLRDYGVRTTSGSNTSIGGLKIPQTSPVISNVSNQIARQMNVLIDFKHQSMILTFLTLIVLGILISLLLYINLEARKNINHIRHKEEEDRELLNLVSNTISTLRASKQPKDIIVTCYLKLRDILINMGLRIEESMTVRETLYKLYELYPHVPLPAINDLILVFEKAVYSDHPITNDDRELALNCLSIIEKHLEDDVI